MKKDTHTHRKPFVSLLVALGLATFLSSEQFSQKLAESDLVIAHAGMGSILPALKNKKPILVMPRFGYLGETRNEHQVATVKRLKEMGKIHVADDETALGKALENLDAFRTTRRLDPWASESLTQKIDCLIHMKTPIGAGAASKS
jgi:UDP-N-acetylglucosamine transferase subunit ALG13